MCPHCTKEVPAEGVVVRVDEGIGNWDVFKLKDFAFLKKESDFLDNDETNIEDVN